MRSLILLLIALLCACGDREPYLKRCDDSGKCEVFATRDELLEWNRQDSLRRRNAALRLNIDYRQLVLAVLKKYLGEDQDPQRDYRMYVDIFDQEIDSSLRASLAEAGISLDAKSECESLFDDTRQAPDTTDLLCMSIPEITSLGDSRYRVPINHYERQGHHQGYGTVAIAQVQGDQWEVLELRGRGPGDF